MKLTERLSRTVRSLANGQPKKPELERELGVSGDFTALYNREEQRKDAVTVEDYRKMLDNDGTVEAIYNLITWSIKAANYKFEAKDGGTKELQLVEDNFLRAPHEGGMSTPFDLVLGDMLRALSEGFRLYERVWKLEGGQVMYKKLAPRDASTVTLKRDENGGFDGARQQVWNGTNRIDVTIPVERCFLFTYAKERDFLYGRSAFRSAYYHYDRKHKLYYLQQLGGEVAAVPGKKLTVPEAVMNNEAKRDAALGAVQDFGGIDSAILLGPDWSLEEYKSTPVDLQKAIDHHDTLIARSILAQFLVLAGSSTGSYSLGESDKENFLRALTGVMKQIEWHVNTFLIPDLIRYNFADGKCPIFKFEDLDQSKKDRLGKAFDTLLSSSSDSIPGDVIKGIVTEVATDLGFDVEEMNLELPGTEPVDPKDPPQPPSDGDGNDDQAISNSDDSDSKNLADDQYERELTDAEKRVNLSELGRKMKTADERLRADTAAFFDGMKDETVKKLTKLLEKGDMKALDSFELPSFKPYKKLLEHAMMEQYLLGKRSAADEVGIKIPQTPSKSRQYMSTQVKTIVDKQTADLSFKVKAEVTKELRTARLSERELGISDVMARVAAAFGAFVSNPVETGIAVSLVGALNLGRQDSFAASNGIDRMQYSAILDGRTTAMCKALDDSVVTYEEYLSTPWKPPVHFNCRSIWVAILKDDSFKPDFRPIPAKPGGQSAPAL